MFKKTVLLLCLGFSTIGSFSHHNEPWFSLTPQNESLYRSHWAHDLAMLRMENAHRNHKTEIVYNSPCAQPTSSLFQNNQTLQTNQQHKGPTEQQMQQAVNRSVSHVDTNVPLRNDIKLKWCNQCNKNLPSTIDYETELIKIKNDPSKHKKWLEAQIRRISHTLAHHCNLRHFGNWLKKGYLKDERDYFVNLYQIACNLEQQQQKATCSSQPGVKSEDFCAIHGEKFSDQNHDLQQKEDIIGLETRHDLIDEAIEYKHKEDLHNVYEDRETSIIQTLVEDLAEVPVSMQIPADDLDLLDTNLVCVEDFGIQKGTAYQQQINKEDHIILHLTSLRDKKISDIDHPVKQVDKKIVKLLKYATDYNKIGLTRRASSITDLCWILSDGADKLLNDELIDFDYDAFKQFLEHIDSFEELHANNIPIAAEFFSVDPNITPQQQQLKTKYGYAVEKVRSCVEDVCVTLAKNFFDRAGCLTIWDQLGILGETAKLHDLTHLFGTFIDFDKSLSELRDIRNEHIQAAIEGVFNVAERVAKNPIKETGLMIYGMGEGLCKLTFKLTEFARVFDLASSLRIKEAKELANQLTNESSELVNNIYTYLKNTPSTELTTQLSEFMTEGAYLGGVFKCAGWAYRGAQLNKVPVKKFLNKVCTKVKKLPQIIKNSPGDISFSNPFAKGNIEIPASHRPLLEGTYKPAQPYKLETKLPFNSSISSKVYSTCTTSFDSAEKVLDVSKIIINKETYKHIFVDCLNPKRKKGTGWHLGRNNPDRINVTNPVNKHGVYCGTWKANGAKYKKFSTFAPDTWNRVTYMDHAREALGNIVSYVQTRDLRIWRLRGIDKLGISWEMFISKNNDIGKLISIYPLYRM